MDAAPAKNFDSSMPAGASAPQRRRSGLQQKLVASFMGTLAVAMGVTCWLAISESRHALDSLDSEQSLEIIRTLGMSSQTPLAARDIASLNRIARNLLKHRDIVAVAFFDVEGRRLAIASEDPNLEQVAEPLRVDPRHAAMEMLKPHRCWLPTLGRFTEVTAPVTQWVLRDRADWLEEEQGAARSASFDSQPQSQLVGYVAICVSQAFSDGIFQRIRVSVIVISAVAMLVTLPIAITLIHRLLDPVRRLVAATDRIAAGDLEAQVAVDRQDVIGTLAISFNRMAQKVREQQGELACANACLAEANRGLEAKVLKRTAQLESVNQKLTSEIAENESLRSELERTLHELREKNDQLEASLKKVEHMAATDPLTGLYNRRHFGKVLEQLFAEARRYDTDLACVMIDLDGYKQLNDTFGHQVGDQLLITAGKVITANLRAMDVAARYGGDEFILLLPRARVSEAASVVSRIRDEFRHTSAAGLHRGEGVTMSVGVGSLQADKPAGAEGLVSAADAALYRAKAAGRNRIVIAAESNPA